LSEMEQAGGDANGMRSLLREKYLRELSPLEASLERLPIMESIAQKIEQAGHSILAHRLVMLAIGLGAAGRILALGFPRMPAAAALAAVVFSIAPFIKINHDRSARLLRIEEQLPDAIDVMRRALQAGHPFNASVKLVAEDMEAPIAREFELAFADINYGN